MSRTVKITAIVGSYRSLVTIDEWYDTHDDMVEHKPADTSKGYEYASQEGVWYEVPSQEMQDAPDHLRSITGPSVPVTDRNLARFLDRIIDK